MRAGSSRCFLVADWVTLSAIWCGNVCGCWSELRFWESLLVCDCLLEDMERERKRASPPLLLYILSNSRRELRDSIVWVEGFEKKR